MGKATKMRALKLLDSKFGTSVLALAWPGAKAIGTALMSNRRSAAPPFKRKPLIEALEPRVLLSADLAPLQATFTQVDLIDDYLRNASISGITVLTHGFELTGYGGDYLSPLSKAIYDRINNQSVQNKVWLLDYDIPGEGAPGVFDLREGQSYGLFDAGGSFGLFDPFEANDPLELILQFDWAHESNELSAGWSEGAGDALFSLLTTIGAVDPERGADNPALHFIGHSFGAAVTSEAIERFAYFDVPVDHVTYLDPHDFDQLTIPVDGRQAQHALGLPQFSGDWNDGYGAAVWDNVAFADVYYQTRSAIGVGATFAVPDGRPIAGAWNRHLVAADLPNPASYGSLDHDHNAVWANFYLDTVTGARPTEGWNYSRLDGGTDTRPATDNFFALDQDHTFTSERLWDHNEATLGDQADGIINVGGIAAIGLTPEELAAARWSPAWTPETAFNAALEFSARDEINSNSNRLPGWNHHGGGGSAKIVSIGANDHAFRLTATDTNRIHNRFYAPSWLSGIGFNVDIANPRSGDVLVVRWTSAADPTKFLEFSSQNDFGASSQQNLALTDGTRDVWIDFSEHPDQAQVQALLGTAVTLEFLLAPAGGSTIRIDLDDVSIRADQLVTGGTGDLLTLALRAGTGAQPVGTTFSFGPSGRSLRGIDAAGALSLHGVSSGLVAGICQNC
jgi:hypothetical protein